MKYKEVKKLEISEEELDLELQEAQFDEIKFMKDEIAELKIKVNNIKKILFAWKLNYMDRKHPYPNAYKLFFDIL